MKQATIRFYTDSKKYKGWCYLLKANLLEIRSWIQSGNNIVIHAIYFLPADMQKIREIEKFTGEKVTR